MKSRADAKLSLRGTRSGNQDFKLIAGDAEEFPPHSLVVGGRRGGGSVMTLRKLHRLSAWLIAGYTLIHIANHLVGLHSVESHIAFMHAARFVYRFPAVELALLLAVGLQVYSGVALIVRGWKRRRGFVSWLQAGSGAYLGFFFVAHVGAVLFGRAVLRLDTNFYFAAAGFYAPPFPIFFAPYYFLAGWAVFAHLGCALYWRLRAKSPLAGILAIAVPSAIGCVLSLLIVLSLAGVFHPVSVPAGYMAIYGGHH